jgi:uncharacterized protein
MTFRETKEFIAKIIRNEFASRTLEIKQIVLFGSRAKETADTDSDWDFLVVLKKELPHPEKNTIITRIQSTLAEKLIDVDIIIKSEAHVVQERNNVGVISYYALKEGVPV